MPPAVRRKLGIGLRLKKLLHPAAQTGFIALVCFGAVLLSLWPLISPALGWTESRLYFYHFLVWGMVILLAFLIGRFALAPGKSRKPDDA